jgi:glutamate/tyrosine decarboxylase-like PLP-dependent enzyme
MAPAINGSVYTYEVAPCFTLMEEEVYDLCKQLLNWESIDGIFTPGGSFANFMSITTSRYNLDAAYKKKGNSGKPLKIFTSETSHYSMKKGAHFCGIGE